MVFRKIVVAVSGGVDSAVSALLLKKKGYDLCAAFMVNWDETDEKGYCTGEKDWHDAQLVCQRLGIEIIKINFIKDYWNHVFRNFLKDYQNGITPNPDILCNRHIKFDHFFRYATENMGADAIATGHYVKTSFGSFLEDYKDNENVRLLRAADTIKDQTFFLSYARQTALRRTIFPIGDYKKSEVKEIAQLSGLDHFAKKRESTGICFIGERNFQHFIDNYLDAKKGNFVDLDTGAVVGEHDGIHHWTLGQRCRLGGYPKPYFVARKIVASNEILVAAGTDHPSLYTKQVHTSVPSWIRDDFILHEGARYEFRFQHTKPLVDCTIYYESTGLNIQLDKPLRAITPGQYAVLYQGQECIGCARIIERDFHNNRMTDKIYKILNMQI